MTSSLKKFAERFGEKKEAVLFFLDILLNIIIIVGLVTLIRTYLISPFQVFGPSMCNTLNYIDDECKNGYGEYIIVNKAVYGNFFGWIPRAPKRGDIIVFHPPHNDKEFFIKRIIGLPGETVKLQNGDVHIYNQEHPEGFVLDEPYLNAYNQHNTKPISSSYLKENSVFEIPESNYFVLGDNRNQSSDSRSCFKESLSTRECGSSEATPFLAQDHIEGRAWLVLWPLNHLKAL